MKYEYTTCTVSKFGDWDDMIARLNDLGKRGWKAYAVQQSMFTIRYFMIRELK